MSAHEEYRSRGFVAPGFQAVRDRFDEFLLADASFSAQVTARRKGEVVVGLAGGPDLDSDAVTGVFSVSKGAAGLVLALLVDSGRLDLDAAVAEYWPEFRAHGKHRLLVREVLSHQSGLVNLDVSLTAEELVHSAAAASRLAAGRPVWRPASAFGYHGLTIGVFAEELVRRITGESLQQFYEREVRAPREIDFYLGLPAKEEHRYQQVLPMIPTASQQAEQAATRPSPDGLMALAFDSLPGGGAAVNSVLPHTRAGRAAGFSSIGGVGSARGIAGMYAAALGHLGEPLLGEGTIGAMSQEQVSGIDRVLNTQMAFAIVFMKPQPRIPFGSYRAFGHDGAGGALGFADPMYDLGFGYIPMPMQYPGGADAKGVELSALVRGCIAATPHRDSEAENP